MKWKFSSWNFRNFLKEFSSFGRLLIQCNYKISLKKVWIELLKNFSKIYIPKSLNSRNHDKAIFPSKITMHRIKCQHIKQEKSILKVKILSKSVKFLWKLSTKHKSQINKKNRTQTSQKSLHIRYLYINKWKSFHTKSL